MVKEDKNNTFAMMTLVAIVAVVGIVALSMMMFNNGNQNSALTDIYDTSDDNAGGMALKTASKTVAITPFSESASDAVNIKYLQQLGFDNAKKYMAKSGLSDLKIAQLIFDAFPEEMNAVPKGDCYMFHYSDGSTKCERTSLMGWTGTPVACTCPNTCFPAGSDIASPNGNVVIETVKAGDVLFSFDFENNQRVENIVESVAMHENPQNEALRILFENDRELQVTANHEIAVGVDKYVTAGSLVVGDVVMSDDGLLVITKIISLGTFDVDYSIHMQNEPHNHYVNGFLVHNKNAGGSGLSLMERFKRFFQLW